MFLKWQLSSMQFPPHLKYLHDPEITWFKPCWGYFGFWERLKQFQVERGIGFEEAWLHRDMKRNKELYATAVVALCMEKIDPGKDGWYFTKPSQDPPDGIIATPREDGLSGANIMSVREVEVVEHLNGSLVETIERKLNRKNKRYEPNTVLVCLMSPQNIETYDFKAMSKEVSAIKLPLANIFVVFNGFLMTSAFQKLTESEKIREMSKITLLQLLPSYTAISILPEDSCSSFLRGEGYGWLKFTGRGKTPGFEKVTLENAPKLFD